MQRLKLGQGKILNVYQRPTTINYNAGWSSFNSQNIGGSVFSVDVDNCNNNVYIGGTFTNIGGTTTFRRVARWTGTSWNNLNGGINSGNIYDIKVDSDRRRIYFGGAFPIAGVSPPAGNAVTVNSITFWDISSSRWIPMPSSNPGTSFGGEVYAIEISGSRVFVGGSFDRVGLVSGYGNIAVWDLSTNIITGSWSQLAPVNDPVYSIIAYGADIYIASGSNILKWNQSLVNWDVVGIAYGGGGQFNTIVRGFNNNLYVGGSFTGINTTVGNIDANNIAIFYPSNPPETSWSPINVNSNNGVNNLITKLVFKNNLLYAGGAFTQAGGLDVSNFAIYNGSSWTTLPGSTFNSEIKSVAVGNNSSIYVGGDFNPVPRPYFATNIATTTPFGGSSSAIHLITASKRIGITR